MGCTGIFKFAATGLRAEDERSKEIGEAHEEWPHSVSGILNKEWGSGNPNFRRQCEGNLGIMKCLMLVDIEFEDTGSVETDTVTKESIMWASVDDWLWLFFLRNPVCSALLEKWPAKSAS